MKQYKGFSLIELLIVVAIIGILATIGMGFYGDHVLSSNRTDGRAALTETAASLEKCRSLYGAYNHANCRTATAYTTDKGLYTISAPTLTDTTFVLNAWLGCCSDDANAMGAIEFGVQDETTRDNVIVGSLGFHKKKMLRTPF